MSTFDCSSAPETIEPRPDSVGRPSRISPEEGVVLKILPADGLRLSGLGTSASGMRKAAAFAPFE